MKIYIHTLGCKANQYESQAMESMFREMGHEISPSASGCDAVIINTCAVTAESVRKSRQVVHHLRSEAPGAVIAVCGCWPQTEPDTARETGADILYGSGNRREFVKSVAEAATNREKSENIDYAMSRMEFEVLPAGSPGTRTRALLKIEDGCSNFCTYCIIPYSRGPVRSLNPDEAASQAGELMERGYREIVLTGIEIASYGTDLPGKPALADVVCMIAAAAPKCRIRLGSLEPGCVTEDFCALLSGYENICNHFHLSLQSGCDDTLRRMNRRYNTESFYSAVELLRKSFPDCGITADLITGFPGETEENFADTLAFIKKCGFSSMHIFPYSVRKGTPAADMPGQVPKSVKKQRAGAASAVARGMKNDFLSGQIGRQFDVLFEQEEDEGIWSGHSSNYCTVHAAGKDLKNMIRTVHITGVHDGHLNGEILAKD